VLDLAMEKKKGTLDEYKTSHFISIILTNILPNIRGRCLYEYGENISRLAVRINISFSLQYIIVAYSLNLLLTSSFSVVGPPVL